jgi:hypothetical protein
LEEIMNSALRKIIALCSIVALVLTLSVLNSSPVGADDREYRPDANIQHFVRNAGVNATSPCNGEFVSTTGLTTVSYDVDAGRRGPEYEIDISYTGSAAGSLGNVYMMTIEAERDFRKPAGGDAYNGYFDLPYKGKVNGPDRLDYKVSGTWRVFIVNGVASADTVLTLRADCARGRALGHDKQSRDRGRWWWDD